MPTYTMELWRVIELKPDNISEDAWLGLDTYELFDSSYRDKLNAKIKNHFMYQEIGHETVEQFRFRMKAKMNEIMPLYNGLYKSVIDFDPLITVDILNTSTADQEQNSTANGQNDTISDIDGKARNVASTFPQVMLGGNADYASNGADSNSQTKTTAKVTDAQTAENNSHVTSESRTKGYQGSPAQLIQQARAAILNVDMLIIAELDELFMMVWNNSDEYSATKGRWY